LSCRSGAALSFVSCIRLFGGVKGLCMLESEMADNRIQLRGAPAPLEALVTV
jgi:hypothetical protein